MDGTGSCDNLQYSPDIFSILDNKENGNIRIKKGN